MQAHLLRFVTLVICCALVWCAPAPADEVPAGGNAMGTLQDLMGAVQKLGTHAQHHDVTVGASGKLRIMHTPAAPLPLTEHTERMLAHVKLLAAGTHLSLHKAKAYTHNFAKAKAGIDAALKALHSQLKIGHDHDEKILKNLKSKSEDGMSDTHSQGTNKVLGYKHKGCPTMRAEAAASAKHDASKRALEAVMAEKICPVGTSWGAMDVMKSVPSYGSELRRAWDKKHAEYVAKAKLYAQAQKEHREASSKHQTSIAAFKTALRIEADNTHSRCVMLHGEYDTLAKDVQSNVGTRKAVYISTLVVKCYVDNLGDKAAAAKCAEKARAADTSQFDIHKAPMKQCVSVNDLRNSMGPMDWTPTTANCKFWKKVLSDLAAVAAAVAAAAP